MPDGTQAQTLQRKGMEREGSSTGQTRRSQLRVPVKTQGKTQQGMIAPARGSWEDRNGMDKINPTSYFASLDGSNQGKALSLRQLEPSKA